MSERSRARRGKANDVQRGDGRLRDVRRDGAKRAARRSAKVALREATRRG